MRMARLARLTFPRSVDRSRCKKEWLTKQMLTYAEINAPLHVGVAYYYYYACAKIMAEHSWYVLQLQVCTSSSVKTSMS